MTQSSVGSMPAFAGLLKDFFRQVEDGSMTLEIARDLLAHRYIRRLRKGDTAEPVYKDQLARWEDRFKRDLSGLWIPEHREGFDRLLFMPQGMRPNKAFDRLSALGFPTRRYQENLDLIGSDRTKSAALPTTVAELKKVKPWVEKTVDGVTSIVFFDNTIVPDTSVSFGQPEWLQHRVQVASKIDENGVRIYADNAIFPDEPLFQSKDSQ